MQRLNNDIYPLNSSLIIPSKYHRNYREEENDDDRDFNEDRDL